MKYFLLLLIIIMQFSCKGQDEVKINLLLENKSNVKIDSVIIYFFDATRTYHDIKPKEIKNLEFSIKADGKYYFLVAANLLSWMKKTFGTPTGSNYLTGAQGGLDGINFPSLVTGKKGIYFMIPNDTSLNGFAATGHADVLENQQCDSGGSSCYFAATGGVKEIYIWELP